MTDSQQRQRLVGLQAQRAPATDADSEDDLRSRSCPEVDREMPGHAEATSPRTSDTSLGGLVDEFEQALGTFQQVLSPGAAASMPDKVTTSSTLMGTSPSSPTLLASSPMSPISPGAEHRHSLAVRVTNDDIGHMELVTQTKLDRRMEELKAFLIDQVREEFTSFESNLDSGLRARRGHLAEELTSFESKLDRGLEAHGARLGARIEALEKEGVQHARDLERHLQDQRTLADRVDGLQQQFAEQEQRVAQELEQLAQFSGQALNCIRDVGPRLDKMLQDHKESVEALETADKQMFQKLQTLDEQVHSLLDSSKVQEEEYRKVNDVAGQMQQFCEHVDVEMRKMEGMLHGPGPSVETDLQKIFEEMEDFKGKLHILNQVQIQDQNDFHEVDMFQKELCQRVNDEMALLRGKVDGITDMVQEDLMGLHNKLSTDIEHLQADKELAPIAFDPLSPSIGAVIVEEPPALEGAAGDDEWRSEMQQLALEVTAKHEAHPEVTEAEPGARTLSSEQPLEHNEQPSKAVCGDTPPSPGRIFFNTLPIEATGDSEPLLWPKPASLGLAELQRTMDQKLDMSLRIVDGFITRHEAKLQQLAEAGNQYSEVQQELLKEIGTVRGNLDELNACKVTTCNVLNAIKNSL